MRIASSATLALLAITTGCGSADSGLAGANSSAGASSSAGAGNTAGSATWNGGGSGGTPAGPGGSAGSGGVVDNGLPCEVTTMLQKYCSFCHSMPPKAGAPQALLSYANLSAFAKSVPGQKLGPLSVTRMQDGTMPPKPFPAPSANEVAAFKAWIDGGMPMTTCSTPTTPVMPMDPYATPLMCTSGKTWTKGDRGSDLMHPGGACIDCHSKGGDGPVYAIAGTVFPSAHEPLDCNGTATSSAGALSVLITDSNGKTHSLPVNSVGNFFYEGNIATPYMAQVVAGSAVRVMAHNQVSGDCNGCHTVTGTSTVAGAEPAPGRIMAP